MTILVEAAVDSLDDALAALEGGADRLELCANLGVGGTTPDEELIAEVMRLADVPVYVMIRPRGGSFVYTGTELDLMKRDIERARELDVDGVVFGVLDTTNNIDVPRTRALVEATGAFPITFHRAFDRVENRSRALDVLIDLGIGRVLTSGGAPTAAEGLMAIEELVEQANGQITILAGGGVRENNVRDLVDETGVTEVHARCEGDASRIRGIKLAATSGD